MFLCDTCPRSEDSFEVDKRTIEKSCTKLKELIRAKIDYLNKLYSEVDSYINETKIFKPANLLEVCKSTLHQCLDMPEVPSARELSELFFHQAFADKIIGVKDKQAQEDEILNRERWLDNLLDDLSESKLLTRFEDIELLSLGLNKN